MPYGSNLGEINPKTGFPDTNPNPLAGGDQGTTLPEGFDSQASRPFTGPLADEKAVRAARVVDIFTEDQ